MVPWCSLECTPACQAGGRGFKSRRDRGRVAQLAERAPEKREVTGSTPVPATTKVLLSGATAAHRLGHIRSGDTGGLGHPHQLWRGHPSVAPKSGKGYVPFKWFGYFSSESPSWPPRGC